MKSYRSFAAFNLALIAAINSNVMSKGFLSKAFFFPEFSDYGTEFSLWFTR